MRVRESGDCKRGQSPVIGVILLVAVAIILATVIATFVLGIGESTTNPPPQVSFSADQEVKHLEASGGDEGDFWALEIAYSNGKPIEHQRLSVLVNGEKAWGVGNYTTANGHRMTGLWDTPGSSITVGDSITVVLTDGPAAGENNTLSINGGSVGNAEVDTDPGGEYQLESGDEVKIVWEAPPGEEGSSILFEQTIEGAN
jgi:flagellin-like protein